MQQQPKLNPRVEGFMEGIARKMKDRKRAAPAAPKQPKKKGPSLKERARKVVDKLTEFPEPKPQKPGTAGINHSGVDEGDSLSTREQSRVRALQKKLAAGDRGGDLNLDRPKQASVFSPGSDFSDVVKRARAKVKASIPAAGSGNPKLAAEWQKKYGKGAGGAHEKAGLTPLGKKIIEKGRAIVSDSARSARRKENEESAKNENMLGFPLKRRKK